MRSRGSRRSSTGSTSSWRSRPRPRSSWPAKVTTAAASATRAGSSSATRWSSRPPSGSRSSTPPTRGWSSAVSTCGAELDAEPRYVGRIGLRDDDHDSLLIDWRAPAAAVFYQATAADPQERRTPPRAAQLPARKVVSVEDELLDAEAEHRPADRRRGRADGPALARPRPVDALDRRHHPGRAGPRDPGAVARGDVSISGGPGTGKTVVALHRAAYLLYTDRRRYESGGVLVVGPSGVFMRYIERVLPSLGETAVALRSLGEVVDGVRATRHDEPAVADVKGSARMAELMRRTSRQQAPGIAARVPHLLARRRDPPRRRRARRSCAAS